MRYIILQHCLVFGCECNLTHTWHWYTVKQLIDEHMLDKDYYAAVDDYNHAIITGIVKIAAKMGISTIQSYQGSKTF